MTSAGSEVFVNGQLDLSTKSAMHSGMDDDIDDGSNCSDDDDIDSKSGKYWSHCYFSAQKNNSFGKLHHIRR